MRVLSIGDEATAELEYPARVFIHSDAGSIQSWAEVVNGWVHRRVLRDRGQWIFHRSKWALGEGRSHLSGGVISEEVFNDVWAKAWDGRTIQDPADVAHALECAVAIRKMDPAVPILYVGDTDLNRSVLASVPDGIRVRPQHLVDHLETFRAAGAVDCSARRRAQQR